MSAKLLYYDSVLPPMLDRHWLPLVQQSLVTAANSQQFTLELGYVSHCGLWGLSKATYYYFGQGVGENDVGSLVFFDQFLNFKAHSFCHFQIDSSF
jgi:hypothetical protein